MSMHALSVPQLDIRSSKKLKVSKAVVANVLEDELHELKADESSDESASFPLKFRGFEVVTVKLTVSVNKLRHESYVFLALFVDSTDGGCRSPSREDWVQILE